MTCASCSSSIESVLSNLPGVLTATVALSTEEAQVVHRISQISPEAIKEAIEDAGFDALLASEPMGMQQSSSGDAEDKILLLVSGLSNQKQEVLIQSHVAEIKGVKDVTVDLLAGTVEVRKISSETSIRDVVEAIEGIEGLQVSLPNPFSGVNQGNFQEVEKARVQFLTAALLTVHFCFCT